ncbi:MAG: hypothetical protein ACYDCN_15620 [Bacteroidia bacterium]
MNIQLPDICYDCGHPLTSETRTREHVPADCFYTGFGNEYKQNRITVPGCKTCNGDIYSKIDQELRDLIAVKNDVIGSKEEFTAKGIRSIIRRSGWKDRVYLDSEGNARGVAFDYNDISKLHIKNFKGLYFRKFGITLSPEFQLAIGTDGDEDKIATIQFIHNYVRDGKEWEVSGHESIFKFILKDITIDRYGNHYESGDPSLFIAVGGILVYHNECVAVIMASKKEFIPSKSVN